MNFQKATLIISVYDNIEGLELVLNSVSKQSIKNFEVIVSEDAENPEMKQFIDNYKYKGEIRHLNHPDIGWQKNKALNLAIEASKTDYLVFIDGDCILHPKFMEYHLKLAEEKKILAGKRIKLDDHTTDLFLKSEILPEEMNQYLFRNYRKMKKNGAQFMEEGFFFNSKSILGVIPRIRSMHQLKGCNMSFPKGSIYEINGFDEDYINPAIGEDIDLSWRFEGLGYTLKSVRNLAVQYHLYHKENWKDQKENVKMMNEKKSQNLYRCNNGLVKR